MPPSTPPPSPSDANQPNEPSQSVDASNAGASPTPSQPQSPLEPQPSTPPASNELPPDRPLGSRPIIYEPGPIPGENPTTAPPGPRPEPAEEPLQPTQTEVDASALSAAPGSVPYQPGGGERTGSPPPASESILGNTIPAASAASASASNGSDSSPLKRGLKIGGIVLGAIVVGVIILVATTSKKGTKSKNQNNNANSSSISHANIPNNYKLIDRPCFSFGLINDNLNAGADGSCFVQARFGAKGNSSFNVLPETTAYKQLSDFVAAKKQQYNSQVASEGAMKLDGIDAWKVVENVGGGQQLVRVYVLTPGKTYTFQSSPLTGFEINGYYGDDYSKQAVDTTLSTWKWK